MVLIRQIILITKAAFPVAQFNAMPPSSFYCQAVVSCPHFIDIQVLCPRQFSEIILKTDYVFERAIYFFSFRGLFQLGMPVLFKKDQLK